MTTTITKQDGTETLRIILVGNEPKLSNIVIKAAHQLWDEGFGDRGSEDNPNTWEVLTNAQKMRIINWFVTREIKLKAIRYADKEAVENAQKDVADTFNNDHEIGD